MTLNAPNILTLLRIALIPVIVIIFYAPIKWAGPISAFIFILAAATDWLDGYLARKLNQSSAFGAFLDPVADKLMVSVALVLLVDISPDNYAILTSISASIIIGREIVISALREWMAAIGERTHVKVSWLGKIKTTFQMLAITFLLFKEPILNIPIFMIGLILLVIAAILTIISMIIYLNAAWPYMRELKK